MSFGIVCLNCRLYVRVGEQQPVEDMSCKCASPRYSEDAKTEITKAEAEQWAHRLAKWNR